MGLKTTAIKVDREKRGTHLHKTWTRANTWQSPTFTKSRRKDEEKENSRERAAASVRHVGHLLQYGSAVRERRLHLQRRRDSLRVMRCGEGREHFGRTSFSTIVFFLLLLLLLQLLLFIILQCVIFIAVQGFSVRF